MSSKLKILDTVLTRLKERKSPFLGELYGVLCDDTLIILSFTVKDTEELTESKYQISENNFPTEIDLYGVVHCKQNLQSYDGSLPQGIKNVFQDVVVSDNPVLLSYGYLDAENNIRASLYKNGHVTHLQYEIMSESALWQQFVLFHLNTPVNFICRNTVADKEKYFLQFTRNISSGAAMFHIDDSDVYLTSVSSDDVSKDVNETDVLCAESSKISPLVSYLRKITTGNTKSPVVINVSMLMKTTCGNAHERSPKRALGIQHLTENFEGIQGCLRLDSLIMFQKNRIEKYLYNALVDSVCRIMKLTKRKFFLHENIAPEIYHFYPSNLGHFVTLVYPENVSDDDLSDVRKYIHCKFNLPYDKPVFRRAIAYSFSESKTNTEQLMNVHVGLPPSGVNGNVSLVQGNYLYYHYNHGNFNDSGWGCAYRSLQTLFSWYKLQGWTDREVPSLNEIQQVLVDIKDKPKSFVGSRKWIGSLEVSFVLDTLLNVTCRVLNVQVGESLADYVHELANHFKKHGTPVMIGGGVLAHTILGVDINDETDAVKFLVLDPHYTNVDNIATIQSKGGIGWKTADFWKKDAFYNLCLPYRKIGV